MATDNVSTQCFQVELLLAPLLHDNWIVSVFLRVLNNNNKGRNMSLFNPLAYNRNGSPVNLPFPRRFLTWERGSPAAHITLTREAVGSGFVRSRMYPALISVQRILTNSSHSVFTLLPSGRRYRSIHCRTASIQSSVFQLYDIVCSVLFVT